MKSGLFSIPLMSRELTLFTLFLVPRFDVTAKFHANSVNGGGVQVFVQKEGSFQHTEVEVTV